MKSKYVVIKTATQECYVAESISELSRVINLSRQAVHKMLKDKIYYANSVYQIYKAHEL